MLGCLWKLFFYFSTWRILCKKGILPLSQQLWQHPWLTSSSFRRSECKLAELGKESKETLQELISEKKTITFFPLLSDFLYHKKYEPTCILQGHVWHRVPTQCPASLHIFLPLILIFAHLLYSMDWQKEWEKLPIKPLFLILWLITHSSLYKCLILFPQNISTLIAFLPRNKKGKLGLTHARIYQIPVVCVLT